MINVLYSQSTTIHIQFAKRGLLVMFVLTILTAGCRKIDEEQEQPHTQNQNYTINGIATQNTQVEDGTIVFPLVQVQASDENTLSEKNENETIWFNPGLYSFDIEMLAEIQKKSGKGDVRAQYILGKYYFDKSTNLTEAVEYMPMAVDLFRQSATQGFAEAQYALGVCYLRQFAVSGGRRPLNFANPDSHFQDYEKAVEWFEKSSEQGYAPAQFSLGYWSRLCSATDYTDAKVAELYRKSAEQGYALAQLWLGLLYDNGIGVEPNATKAAEWHGKASKNGRLDAINDLYALYQLRNDMP